MALIQDHPRWIELSTAAKEVAADALTTGNYLDSDIARAVMDEAAQSLYRCEGCNALRGVCARPGADIYDMIRKQEHKQFSKVATLPQSILHVIHATANLQGFVNKAWYTKASLALRDELNLPHEEGVPDAAIIEVVVLTSLSCAIKSFACMTGDDHLLVLPEVTRTPAKSIPLDTFVKKIYASRGEYPYSPAVQFKQDAEKVVGLPQEFLESLHSQIPPHSRAALNPYLANELARICAAFYLPMDAIASVSGEVPKGRTLTRSQLESVAAGLTAELGCAF